MRSLENDRGLNPLPTTADKGLEGDFLPQYHVIKEQPVNIYTSANRVKAG